MGINSEFPSHSFGQNAIENSIRQPIVNMFQNHYLLLVQGEIRIYLYHSIGRERKDAESPSLHSKLP